METATLAVVLLIVLVFAGMVAFAVSSSRRQKESKAQLAQQLGMAPVPQPDPALAEKIADLHRVTWGTSKYELRNVSRRSLPDGELYLFDLVDTSGDGDSWTQTQAVAIQSASLRLPPFQFYPKVDTQKYALGALANRIVEWGASKVGTPVHFPAFPDFEARYSITSSNPVAVQQFFDERMARYFANTEYYTLHAAADLFVFAEIEPGFKVTDPSLMNRRIDRALEIHRLFQR